MTCLFRKCNCSAKLFTRSDPRLHEVTWLLYETQKWKENLAVRRTKSETGYNLCILYEVSARWAEPRPRPRTRLGSTHLGKCWYKTVK